ncbi:hypothetical protein [Pseudoalteromonas sp. MMG005]|uniref:hypothetical protein n=1 Tax=Pseudoalteromonas sp. MMG005 TaxID=2822682 RepID=UPI001B39FEB3|nr:hypothetical protein [Pseudoalteromonas sp. MMG005]MBQ4846686.1 hypothetical protein [Pseudoalteromonas sp. MMG005]
MKQTFSLLFTLILLVTNSTYANAFSCNNTQYREKSNVEIRAFNQGAVYLNGQFTGQYTPAKLNLPPGKYSIGVGLEKEKQYLKKQINVLEKHTPKKPMKVTLSHQAIQPASKWRALFVGVPSVYAGIGAKKCHSNFTQHELDEGYNFFKQNLREHIEPFSYGTIKWDINRQDLSEPVELTHNPDNDWYTLEAQQGLAQLKHIKPGDYDTIFLFWRAEMGDCSFESPYFGLAWLEPTSPDTLETGYVTVKFNPGEMGVKQRINKYLNDDPGVWTHEWLHVVIEQFYPNKGVSVPIPPKDKLILHAASEYGYTYPWMDWYKDLISGQVRQGKGYSGLGPETFLDCTIRQQVKKQCKL